MVYHEMSIAFVQSQWLVLKFKEGILHFVLKIDQHNLISVCGWKTKKKKPMRIKDCLCGHILWADPPTKFPLNSMNTFVTAFNLWQYVYP